MRKVTGFGGHLCDDFGRFKELGVRFNKQQPFCSTGFEIDTAGFEELIVRVIGFRETLFEENNKRVTGLPQGAGYLFLAFGDSGGDEYGAVSGFVKALVFASVYLLLRQTSRALEDCAVRALHEKHIAKRSARDTGNFGVLMDTEEVGISALKPEAAGIVMDIIY